MECGKPKSCPTHLEVEGKWLTKPAHIASYFSDFFSSEISNLRNNMQQTSTDSSITRIKELVMNKKCEFKIARVSVKDVECLIKKCKERPPGVDNLEVRFLSLAASVISVPVCHIVNLSTEKCICPQAWKIAKIIPLKKNPSAPFSGTNSRPISLLPALGKVMERIIFEQNIQ